MIIIICDLGLANRLFYFAHCMALGEATGHSVVCITFPDFDPCFEAGHGALCWWPPSVLTRFFSRPVLFRRALNFILRRIVIYREKLPLGWLAIINNHVTNTDTYNAGNPAFLQRLKSSRLILFTGWPAIEKMVIPSMDKVREFFKPKEVIASAIRNHLLKAKGDADILVGVHFRWGDFRGYGDGCFYYSPEAYGRVMRHYERLFPGKRVAFLAVTNDQELLQQSLALFAPMKVTTGLGGLVEDLYSLAGCDYIVCPASSYSLWAAFYGAKPVWCMRDADSLPALEDLVIPGPRFDGLHPEVPAAFERGLSS